MLAASFLVSLWCFKPYASSESNINHLNDCPELHQSSLWTLAFARFSSILLLYMYFWFCTVYAFLMGWIVFLVLFYLTLPHWNEYSLIFFFFCFFLNFIFKYLFQQEYKTPDDCKNSLDLVSKLVWRERPCEVTWFSTWHCIAVIKG